jgi:hypothetical protein
MTSGPIAKLVPGKGQHYDLCVLDFNLDIESGVCSIALDKDGQADRDKACSYCYAKYLYKKSPDAYRVKIIKESEFKKIATKYPAHILRLGKNYECGSKISRAALIQVLEYCVKYKMRPVVTSKLLEFDKKVADLVTESKGVVHISLGDDELETGAVAQGATNRWRLAQAIRYKRYGTPVQVRIVSDVTMSMNKFHEQVFQHMGSRGILLTPLHYTNKADFAFYHQDITWDEAKKTGLFSYTHGDLRPNVIHKDWSKVKERCGTVAGKEYCNNCVGKIDFNKKEYKEKLIELGWNTTNEVAVEVEAEVAA